jgi:hypothetical protein
MSIIELSLPPDDPAAVSWEEYVGRASGELAALLQSGAGEETMQDFLERNPPFVPTAFPDVRGSRGGHGPWGDALVTQPMLQGFGKKIPDFMWLTRNTAFLRPVFVEIEAPGKRWIADGDRPSADLTQALNQFRQWEEWLDVAANRVVFYDTYQVPPLWRVLRKWKPLYVLIYGRESEDSMEIPKLRAAARENQLLLTWDHLEPDWQAQHFLTAQYRRGALRAKFIPPTIKFVPSTPDQWNLVVDRDDAVAASKGITTDRRNVLNEQIRLGNEWSSNGGRFS